MARVPVDGGTLVGDGEDEVELDMEIIAGMLPRLGQILVYESPNNTAAIIDQYQQIANENHARVVSTSWGSCEQVAGQAKVAAEYSIFAQMAAQGQSIFAASGDTGSEDCLSANGSTALAVDNPASQPYVTGVGGTRLSLDPSNTDQYNGEAVWNNYNDYLRFGASGGGLSTVWPKPSYQIGMGTTNPFSNGMRQVPDVAALADPFRGDVIYLHDPTGCPSVNGGADCFEFAGGTSAAAPMWAAGVALGNEYRASVGLPGIGFANVGLYRAVTLHTISSGDNCFAPTTCGNPNSGLGTYPARGGYSQATGLGSFDLGLLVAEFQPPPTVTTISPTFGSSFGAETVTITGTNFYPRVMGAWFGPTPVPATFVNPTTIIVTTPPGNGTVDVSVTVIAQRVTVANAYSYFAPITISSISPPNGSTDGGTAITITGFDIDSGATVLIDGVAANGVVVAAPNEITAVTPPHAAGVVDVAVRNPNGMIKTVRGAFTYQLRPGPVIPGGVPNTSPSPRSQPSPAGTNPEPMPAHR